MKKLLTAAALTAVMFGASAAYAQSDDIEFYVIGEGDEMRVMGGDSAEGVVIIGDETYDVPTVCPEGSFYWSGENLLTECGVDGRTFALAEPASGAMMRSGQPFPTGARVMTAEDDQDDDDGGSAAPSTNDAGGGDESSDGEGGDAGGDDSPGGTNSGSGG